MQTKLYQSTLPKILNNADVAKRFWKINAVRPINKGISGKIEESPQRTLLLVAKVQKISQKAKESACF
jgi:hypothetical protein